MYPTIVKTKSFRAISLQIDYIGYCVICVVVDIIQMLVGFVWLLYSVICEIFLKFDLQNV